MTRHHHRSDDGTPAERHSTGEFFACANPAGPATFGVNLGEEVAGCSDGFAGGVGVRGRPRKTIMLVTSSGCVTRRRGLGLAGISVSPAGRAGWGFENAITEDWVVPTGGGYFLALTILGARGGANPVTVMLVTKGREMESDESTGDGGTEEWI